MTPGGVILKPKPIKLGRFSMDRKHIFSALLGFVLIWQLSIFYSPTRRFYEDQTKHLLNIKHFHYLYNNDVLCSLDIDKVHDKLLIILVHTARANVDSRNAIRKTWGRLNRFLGWKIRLVFLIGSENPSDLNDIPEHFLKMVNSSIEMEDRKYNDIVMGNFYDVYRNMTYKHFMGYKWVLDYCSNAKFLLRVDDDMFVDIFQVIEFISNAEKSSNDSFYCYIMRDRPPERGESKWGVTKEEYPLDVYPNYCLGAGYLANAGVVPKLYSVLDLFKYFWIDDVLVGILSDFYNSQLTNATIQNKIEMEDIAGKYEFYKDNLTERIWDERRWMFTLIDRGNIENGAMERLWEKAVNNSFINYSLKLS